MGKDIRDIIISAKNGDVTAIGQLYEEFQNKGIAYAKQYVKSQSTAEDMFQDSFIKAIEHLDSFDDSKQFGPWLNTIIGNTCKNHLARSRMTNFSDISDEEFDYIDTIENTNIDFMPEESLDKGEMFRIMDEIIGTLPEAQRSALLMFYYKDMSVKQIATIQEVSEDTVKSRLNYSRKKVAAAVEDYQKKSGIKLYSIALVPLCFYMYCKFGGVNALAAELESKTERIDTDKPDVKSIAGTASAKAASAGIIRKAVIIAAIAALGTGAGITAYYLTNNSPNELALAADATGEMPEEQDQLTQTEDTGLQQNDMENSEDNKTDENMSASAGDSENAVVDNIVEIPENTVKLVSSDKIQYVIEDGGNLRPIGDGRYLMDVAVLDEYYVSSNGDDSDVLKKPVNNYIGADDNSEEDASAGDDAPELVEELKNVVVILSTDAKVKIIGDMDDIDYEGYSVNETYENDMILSKRPFNCILVNKNGEITFLGYYE